MEDFIAKSERLLDLERKAEVEQCEQFLSTQIMQDSKQLESKGVCVTKLSVSHQRIGLYGRNIVTFTKRNKNNSTKDIPCNRLTVGTYDYEINSICHSIPIIQPLKLI